MSVKIKMFRQFFLNQFESRNIPTFVKNTIQHPINLKFEIKQNWNFVSKFFIIQAVVPILLVATIPKFRIIVKFELTEFELLKVYCMLWLSFNINRCLL